MKLIGNEKREKSGGGHGRIVLILCLALAALLAVFVICVPHRAEVASVVMSCISELLIIFSFGSFMYSSARRAEAERMDKEERIIQYGGAMRRLIFEHMQLEDAFGKACELIESHSASVADEKSLLDEVDGIRERSYLETVLENKRKMCELYGIEFSVTSAAKLTGMDSVEIVSLFGNLLDNAVTAARGSGCDKPSVSGSVKEAAGNVLIELTNSKPRTVTMSKRDFRLRGGNARKGIGTGNIARIVNAHNGDIAVKDSGDSIYIRITMGVEA